MNKSADVCICRAVAVGLEFIKWQARTGRSLPGKQQLPETSHLPTASYNIQLPRDERKCALDKYLCQYNIETL